MKKGQVFTTDYIIGLMIFIFMLVMGAKILVDIVPSYSYEIVYRDGLYIADLLVDEGYPSDWNSSTVVVPGVCTNFRLDKSKLVELDGIDYGRTKTLFHTEGDYLFFFKNKTEIMNISNCTYGFPISVNSSCDPQLDTISYDHLSITERMIIYNSSVIKLVVYSWD